MFDESILIVVMQIEHCTDAFELEFSYNYYI